MTRRRIKLTALGDIRSQETAGVSAEQGVGIGALGVAVGCLVVVGGKDAVQGALLEAALGTSLVDQLGTALNVALLDTAGLELGCAVAEVADLGRGQILAPLLDLLGNGVAWVGCGSHGHHGREDGVGEEHNDCVVVVGWWLVKRMVNK